MFVIFHFCLELQIFPHHFKHIILHFVHFSFYLPVFLLQLLLFIFPFYFLHFIDNFFNQPIVPLTFLTIFRHNLHQHVSSFRPLFNIFMKMLEFFQLKLNLFQLIMAITIIYMIELRPTLY